MWYRTLPEMEAAGLTHLLHEMVDTLERVWNYKFPPGYTEVTGGRKSKGERARAAGRPGQQTGCLAGLHAISLALST
jgi:hypothetical protein